MVDDRTQMPLALALQQERLAAQVFICTLSVVLRQSHGRNSPYLLADDTSSRTAATLESLAKLQPPAPTTEALVRRLSEMAEMLRYPWQQDWKPFQDLSEWPP